ncbi:MAG: hypothetical protein GX217_02275, partial [Clostridiaceae bacterium]|nr:hypothetical protein [Clostridiaceae bacterium]
MKKTTKLFSILLALVMFAALATQLYQPVFATNADDAALLNTENQASVTEEAAVAATEEETEKEEGKEEAAASDQLLNEALMFTEDDSNSSTKDTKEKGVPVADEVNVTATDQLTKEVPVSNNQARSMEVMAQPKSSGVRIDATNFPDANFREHVRQYDEDEDGIL